MPVQFTNRLKQTYYLLENKSKKGKTIYNISSKLKGKGKPVEQMPEEYEIYENPKNAHVFCRKKLPQLITNEEKQLVEQYVKKLKGPYWYLTYCELEYITIYESAFNVEEYKELLLELTDPSLDYNERLERVNNHMTINYYDPVIRFQLNDPEKRLFTVERKDKEDISGWTILAGPGNLKKSANKYIKITQGIDLFEEVLQL